MLFVIFQDSGITFLELSPFWVSPPQTPCRCHSCGMIGNVSSLPQDCGLLETVPLPLSSQDSLCLAQCLTHEKCPLLPQCSVNKCCTRARPAELPLLGAPFLTPSWRERVKRYLGKHQAQHGPDRLKRC